MVFICKQWNDFIIIIFSIIHIEMSELLFGFRDLINGTEQKNRSLFDFSSIVFNDDYLKKLNPKRYNFYVKFVMGLSNPMALERFLYKTKETRDFKDDFKEKIQKFTTLLSKLNESVDSDKKAVIINNIKNTLKNKYKYSDNIIDKIESIFNTTSIASNRGGGTENSILDDAKYKTLKTEIDGKELNTGKNNINNFITAVEKVAPELGAPKPMENVEDLLYNPDKKIPKTQKELIQNLSPIYNKYKDNLSPKNLEISTIDRIIFIGITFIIRFITLMIINWGLTTNLINSFYSAFIYYCFIYLLFFTFITMIVNVIVYYPLLTLFSSVKIITLPNYLYYFYIYTNGYMRLLLHILIIILILFIPYIINIDKLTFLKNEENKPNISYDYEKKRKILDSIAFFSLIIWIITTIIAIKF